MKFRLWTGQTKWLQFEDMAHNRLPQLMRLPNGLEIAYLDHREAAFIYQEIFCEEKYLAHGLELSERSVVVDVGANIGLFCLFVQHRILESRVYAIEPISDIIDVLRFNLRDKPSCRILPIGLSNIEGSAILTFYPKSPGMSSRHADFNLDRRLIQTVLANTNPMSGLFAERLIEHRLRAQPVQCQLRQLSSVIDDEGITQIDLVKIDVEKSEMEVLAGIEDRHWACIRQFVIEVHDLDGRLREIARMLKQRGYLVHVEQDPQFRGTDVHLIYAKRK